MARDDNALAKMDCFHCFYRLCHAGNDSSAEQSRYEAWLVYKEAVVRRDGQRCSTCGSIRPAEELDIQPVQSRPGLDRLAPDNVQCICLSCRDPMNAMVGSRQRHLTQ